MKTDRELFRMIEEYSKTDVKNTGVQRRQWFKRNIIDKVKELNPGRRWNDSTDDTIIWQELQEHYPSYNI